MSSSLSVSWFFVLCQAGLGSQNVTVNFLLGGEHGMKRELARSDKQGLAPNILQFFFGVAIAGSDKQGLAPKILQFCT